MQTDPTKPLFIPLMRRWFEAFERGEKTHEWRRYGGRWNERTVTPGKRAILSLGYSGRRLEAVVVGFERRQSLPDSDTFGPGVDCIVIELADIRPSDWHAVGRTTPEKLAAATHCERLSAGGSSA